MVTLSSTETEVYAAIECTKDIIFFRDLLKEIGYEQLVPTTLHVDNKSAIVLSQPLTGEHRKVRHFMARLRFLIEQVEKQIIKLEHLVGTILPTFFRNRSLDLATNKTLLTYWVLNAMAQIFAQNKFKRHYQPHKYHTSIRRRAKPSRQPQSWRVAVRAHGTLCIYIQIFFQLST
jgi:hypothetical protein